jgi:hypothetical protein
MSLEQRLDHLASLGERMLVDHDEVVAKAYEKNRWFTPENCEHAITQLSKHFLDYQNLGDFSGTYDIPEGGKRIGIVMAGNLPLVGFHDLLCVLLTGHKAVVKLSGRDQVLLTWIKDLMNQIDPDFGNQVEFVDTLQDFDGVIATGSNNTGRYFKEYFGKYPNIIRLNRGSVAVLSGDETTAELEALGEDLFRYFGLGCRNVSKLYVPEGYKFDQLFESIESWRPIIDHEKYKNNFDYNLTLLLMNSVPYFSNDFVMITAGASIVSPIASIHYEEYEDRPQVESSLQNQAEEIQCVVAQDENQIDFGKTQEPALKDFADHIDTVDFLIKL